METRRSIRYNSTGIEELIGKVIPVLDKGFVVCIDYMGNDLAVVDAARISTGNQPKSAAEDEKLIRYLMRNQHWSPFEQAELKVKIKAPIYVLRQLDRHRSAHQNQQSARYSEMEDCFHRTDPSEWRLQGLDNKQGSEGFVSRDMGISMTQREKEVIDKAYEVYSLNVKNGVAKEQARKVLPVSLYSEIIWKVDLRNLLHLLKLRLDKHAQIEIRVYAEELAKIVKEWVPWTWKAFEDYELESFVLSKIEKRIISECVSISSEWSYDFGYEKMMEEISDVLYVMKENGMLEYKEDGKTLKKSRERDELREKLIDMNVTFIPWELFILNNDVEASITEIRK